jgi:capsule polysaccharide export protein KpsE/RkpR
MSTPSGLIARLYDRLGARLGAWLGSASIPRHTTRATLLACALAVVYWGVLASDRYVSEAHIVVPRIDVAGAPSMDLGTFLTGATGGGRADQLLLRSYLLSVDMLNRLDKTLGLRAHYSDTQRDLLSRMWSADISQEWFYRYFLSRVSVEYDDYSGVLVLRAQAYDPQTAHAIVFMLLEEGERYTLIADLKARRNALLRTLAPQAPAIVDLEFQVAAAEQRIARERARPVKPGNLVTSKLTVLQAPTLPQYPLEPRRMYNIVIFVLIALVLAGVVRLLAAIIRDHKD